MRTLLYITLVFCVLSCSKSSGSAPDQGAKPEPVTPIQASQNSKNKVEYFKKTSNGAAVKIACEGTSITYGQNTTDATIIPAAPGYPSGFTRSEFQYPFVLRDHLKAVGIKANVISRSYPGDRTTEGLSRWKDSISADVTILEYATNDALNNGKYPDGIVSVAKFETQLSALIERRLGQGAWVIICTPPEVRRNPTALLSYTAVIRNLAAKYDLPVFEVQQNIQNIGNIYSDNVHLNAAANLEWGNKISALLKKQ